MAGLCILTRNVRGMRLYIAALHRPLSLYVNGCNMFSHIICSYDSIYINRAIKSIVIMKYSQILRRSIPWLPLKEIKPLFFKLEAKRSSKCVSFTELQVVMYRPVRHCNIWLTYISYTGMCRPNGLLFHMGPILVKKSHFAKIAKKW